MPELRKDPLIGRWVIIATERAKRPVDFIASHDEPLPQGGHHVVRHTKLGGQRQEPAFDFRSARAAAQILHQRERGAAGR